MKVQGIDGRMYVLDLRDKPPRGDCSSLHKRARILLAKLFPLEPRREEVPVPGSAKGMAFDFFLPTKLMAVEVQGRQHTQQVGFFHEHRTDFYRGRLQDEQKVDFCLLNDFVLVRLPYDEDDDQWANRILGGPHFPA